MKMKFFINYNVSYYVQFIINKVCKAKKYNNVITYKISTFIFILSISYTKNKNLNIFL